MLLRRFGKIFNNTISIPEQHIDQPVFAAKLKRSKFKLGSKLIVPVDFSAYVIYRGKNTDVFYTGTHKLLPGTLPNVMKKVKPRKVKSKKKVKFVPVKKIKADIVFVSNTKFEIKTFDNINIMIDTSDEPKQIKSRLELDIELKIEDSLGFLTSILSESPRINNANTIKLMRKWATQRLISFLESKRMSNIEEILNHRDDFLEKYMHYLEKPFAQIGLNIVSVDLRNLFIPKKHEQKLLKSPSEKDVLAKDSNNSEKDNDNDAGREYKSSDDNSIDYASNKLTDENKGDNFKRCKKCGQQISKDEFVCKYCRSINI